MFRPPTGGYEEDLDLTEYLVPKPSATLFVQVDRDFLAASLSVGDVVIVEQDRKPQKNGMLVLAEYLGDTFLCLLHKKPNNKLFAVTDTRSGRVNEDEFLIRGVVTFIIKNQINDNQLYC